MLVLHAAREICEEEGFDELLDSVRERIDEIESLHRTSELTVGHFMFGSRLTPHCHTISSVQRSKKRRQTQTFGRQGKNLIHVF